MLRTKRYSSSWLLNSFLFPPHSPPLNLTYFPGCQKPRWDTKYWKTAKSIQSNNSTLWTCRRVDMIESTTLKGKMFVTLVLFCELYKNAVLRNAVQSTRTMYQASISLETLFIGELFMYIHSRKSLSRPDWRRVGNRGLAGVFFMTTRKSVEANSGIFPSFFFRP